MADEQQIPGLSAQRPSFSAWIGVVLLFLVFGLFVLVAFGAAPRGSDYEKKRAAARLEKLKTAHAETTKALTTYAWIDKSKGVARIPINDAIHITMMELAQKQPAPANPITPQAEPGAAQNTAPVTAPPGGLPPAAAPSATPVSKGGHESETGNQHAATVNPAPVAPGTQPGPSSTPAAPPPPQSGQPNLAGSPPPQTPPTPHGSPLPVRGKTPSP